MSSIEGLHSISLSRPISISLDKEESLLLDLPNEETVETALKKIDEQREIKRHVGKWLVGIGAFAAVTLAGILVAGTVLAIISNPVGWGIGIGLALALTGAGIFLVAKYGKDWKDAVIPLLIGAAVGLIVVVLTFILMSGRASAPSFSTHSGIHAPSTGFYSGHLLGFWLYPTSLPSISNRREYDNIQLIQKTDLSTLKATFSTYLENISIAPSERHQFSFEQLEGSNETIQTIYQQAIRLAKKEKYKEAAELLYRIKESSADHTINHEFSEVVARAYPKAVHIQLQAMKETPYYDDKARGNPRQAFNLARSLFKTGHIEEARHVLSLAYSIAYKENHEWARKNENDLTNSEKMYFEQNAAFMKEANLAARQIFKKEIIALP